MRSKQISVSLVAVLVLSLLLISMVSAYPVNYPVRISTVEISGVNVLHTGSDLSSFAGQTVPVKIVFHAYENASDTRVKVWLSGASGLSVSSERFDVLSGRDYSNFVTLQMPSNIDPSEQLQLEVSVESRNEGILGQESIAFTVQRESYVVEILDVNVDNKVAAGSNLALNLVLKNRGMHTAEDTFVKAKIPSLGIEEKAYFGDLTPVDQSDNEHSMDAAERRMLLKIPSNVKPGIYTLEIEAYNADATTTTSKKIAIVGASEDSIVVSSVKSKTFAAGESADYTLTIVNSGDKVAVYNLVLDAPDGLIVNADETVVAVPAGSSKSVKLVATASKVGIYDFTASVQSGGDLVKKESFVANVEGTKATTTLSGNTTMLLTVVLAIIFVVLLVVLIVLLTRKPEKPREFGESYY